MLNTPYQVLDSEGYLLFYHKQTLEYSDQVKRVPNQTKGGDLLTSKQFGPKTNKQTWTEGLSGFVFLVMIWSTLKNIRRGTIFDLVGMFGVTFTDTNALLNIKNHLQYHYQLGLVEEEY